MKRPVGMLDSASMASARTRGSDECARLWSSLISRRLPSAALTISTRQMIRRLLAASAAASTSTSSAETSSADAAEAAHRRQAMQVMARLPVQRAQVVEQHAPGAPGPDRAERQDGGMRHLRPGREEPGRRFGDGGIAEAAQRVGRRLTGFRRPVLQAARQRPDAAARRAA